jgi:hypothetical protein
VALPGEAAGPEQVLAVVLTFFHFLPAC